MKFRLGVIVGFAAGYYLGAMAGRQRYEQINRMLRRARRSDAFDTATEKAKAVVDLGVERARDAVEGKISGEVVTTQPNASFPARDRDKL